MIKPYKNLVAVYQLRLNKSAFHGNAVQDHTNTLWIKSQITSLDLSEILNDYARILVTCLITMAILITTCCSTLANKKYSQMKITISYTYLTEVSPTF